jgi:hypothetical protein
VRSAVEEEAVAGAEAGAEAAEGAEAEKAEEEAAAVEVEEEEEEVWPHRRAWLQTPALAGHRPGART